MMKTHSENMIKVCQTIPHIIMDVEGVKPSPFPPKIFTNRYKEVKYPYSVVKHKAYPIFGLEIEQKVVIALRNAYKNKFVGDVDSNLSAFEYLSEKDANLYLPFLTEYIDEIVQYFIARYPRESILKISYQQTFDLCVPGATVENREVTTISGSPDIVVWLDANTVAIYDIHVFGRTNISINKNIRIQMCSYAALARSMGVCCNYIGVIMPWARVGEAVCDFDITKWKEASLINTLINVVPRVLAEKSHFLTWTALLTSYGVGSHVCKETAIDISRLKGDPVTVPFQIFLYGNNTSNQLEIKGRVELKKLNLDFTPNTIFVHAPYNITLCSPGSYIVEAIKAYLEDANSIGAKGVVFHTGHHKNEEEGLKIMKSNIAAVRNFINPQTPLIIETPCGNKNEMLNTPEKFSKFILDCPERLVGVCVDTCHVFVSGVAPLDYFKALGYTPETALTRTAWDQVCLIHFNGSRKKFGCCADGHARMTKINNIPSEQMEGVLILAKKFNIPCLVE